MILFVKVGYRKILLNQNKWFSLEWVKFNLIRAFNRA